MIRPATVEDIPRIIELGHKLHMTSRYAAQEFDPGVAASFIEGLISGHGVVFVAVINGQIVGGFAGGIVEQWFSTQKVAYDYSFFIEPEHRSGITAIKLLRAPDVRTALSAAPESVAALKGLMQAAGLAA